MSRRVPELCGTIAVVAAAVLMWAGCSAATSVAPEEDGPAAPPRTVPPPDPGIDVAEPAPPPADVREFLDLDPYYQQWVGVEGFPVIAAANVNPYALKEAAWLITIMLGHRKDVLHAMRDTKVRFAVIGHTEVISRLPEYQMHEKWPDFLAWPYRGFGHLGRTSSAGEENILHYPKGGGSYSILIHEFAHAIHLLGLDAVDVAFDSRLEAAYRDAVGKELWRGTYASTDHREYWAEGTVAWFFPAGGGSFRRFGSSRRELKQYDRALADLLAEIYGDSEWRYTPPSTRIHLPHLRGFDPGSLPTFEGWPELEELHRQFYNDFESDGGRLWEDLERHDLSDLARLVAKPRGPRDTAIGFLNLTDEDLEIHEARRDGDGRIRTGYWTLVRAHRSRARPARINQVYVIRKKSGAAVAVFQVGENTGRAIIRG